MPNISTSAKIICPYFIKEIESDRTSIFCCPIFENQQTTRLKFKSLESKLSHQNNFCATGFYQGCPIAIAAGERLELNVEI